MAKKSRLPRFLFHALVALIALPIALTVVYRFLPVPLTPLMIIRLFQGEGLHKTWIPLESISPSMRRAAVAAEDSLFCEHDGFDWKALNKAYTKWQNQNPNRRARKIKGGSTISQQTAKNLFLWPSSTVTRKVIEAPLTILLETILPKQRILEIYLNVAEFGPGIYGVEAAAQKHFRTHAKNLTAQQSALLAAVLPNPRRLSASHPSPYVRQRAGLIQGRTRYLGPLGTCTKPLPE